MKLSVAIMAHTSRRELWAPLASRVQKAAPNNLVDVYPDDGRLGRWGNGRRCLLGYQPDATHHLVLQDDALPAADLVEGIEAWLPRLPHSILCLYSGKLTAWRQIHDRYATPPCWLQMEQIQWGVALVVPTEYLPTLVKRADMLTRIENYDLRLSEANRRTYKLPVLYPTPSWVNHANTPSTVPGRKANRCALTALTQEQSVLDWAEPGQAAIVKVPDFTRRATFRQLRGNS